MDEIKINDKISYIASSENPLSAEIGIEKVVFNVFKDIDLEIYDKLLNR